MTYPHVRKQAFSFLWWGQNLWMKFEVGNFGNNVYRGPWSTIHCHILSIIPYSYKIMDTKVRYKTANMQLRSKTNHKWNNRFTYSTFHLRHMKHFFLFNYVHSVYSWNLGIRNTHKAKGIGICRFFDRSPLKFNWTTIPHPLSICTQFLEFSSLKYGV